MADQRPWIKVTTEFATHPKTLQLSDRAFRSLILLWCHAGAYKTDGFLPKKIVKNFAKPSSLRELISLQFLEETSDPNTYRLHDWNEHQTEKAVIKNKVDVKKKAGSLGGKASAHERWHASRGITKPDCEMCQAPDFVSKQV